MCSSAFVDGAMVIFRLAPQVFLAFFRSHFNFVYNLISNFTFNVYLLQDYHRFHFPVSGIIEQTVDIPGYLYTVCETITRGK